MDDSYDKCTMLKCLFRVIIVIIIGAGWLAPQAAGVIHTDFEKGFIKADVHAFADLKELGSEEEVKKAGKMKQQGKNYVVRVLYYCVYLILVPRTNKACGAMSRSKTVILYFLNSIINYVTDTLLLVQLLIVWQSHVIL